MLKHHIAKVATMNFLGVIEISFFFFTEVNKIEYPS
jgi:hypothetical protein